MSVGNTYNHNNPRERFPMEYRIAYLAVGALAVAGILIGINSEHSSRHAAKPDVTFDALGGGSNVIEVFPGVAGTLQDETHNGTYYAGKKIGAICQTIGRTIHSNTAVGELNRKSNIWVQIVDPVPGEFQYAAATYLEPNPVIKHLPQC